MAAGLGSKVAAASLFVEHSLVQMMALLFGQPLVVIVSSQLEEMAASIAIKYAQENFTSGIPIIEDAWRRVTGRPPGFSPPGGGQP